MIGRFLLAAALAAVAAPLAAQGAPATPLFASDAVLRLTISGDLDTLVRADSEERPTVAGTLAVAGGESVPVQLQPRGITRRAKDVCQFPPLRVRFTGTPSAASPFAGQRQLKLVTHCRAAANFNQYTLLEYAAYRLYADLTPLSMRARLASVDYVGRGGKTIATRYGFFIEDADDAAKRNGMREAKLGDRFPVSRLAPADSARFALFQYMIGNLDWAMQAGPPGDECCHNSKPIGLGGSAATAIVPVPYDFDFAGMVNAPYATPPFGVPVSNVRQRRYRGLCRHNAEAKALLPAFRAQQARVAGILASVPGLEASSQAKALAYLNSFYADIASDEQAAAKIFRTCLG